MNIIFSIVLVLVIHVTNGQDISSRQWTEYNTSRNFTGKVVLVTESTHGIERVITALFSRLGAQVVVTGGDGQQVSNTAKTVRELSPRKLKPLEVVADVTKTKDLDRLLRETLNKYGKLDVLVTRMAMVDVSGIKHHNFMSMFDDMMKNNLRSTVYLTKLAVPHLLKTNGTIISLSCFLAVNPRPFTMAFSTAMTGIDTMVKVLAMELGPRVRVNSINVGVIDMEMPHDELINFVKARVKIDAPLQRLGEPMDVAKAVVYLASTDAKFITGVNLRIDGGYSFSSL